jgi:hypothetical protein
MVTLVLPRTTLGIGDAYTGAQPAGIVAEATDAGTCKNVSTRHTLIGDVHGEHS